jgi:hypothetical protein
LAANGEIIATGESYPSKAAVMKGVASIKKNAPVAGIVDETVEKAEAKKPAAKAKKAPKAKAAKKVTDNKDVSHQKPRGRKPKAE